MTPYDQPVYYEIAFSFFDVGKQCDLIEKFVRQYSLVPVKRCLDIACGPSLQLRELARRGYETIGIDNSARMLRYLRQEAREDGLRIETVKADMTSFTLDRKVDLALIMMGTISVIGSNRDLLSHLDSVARCLKKGGLYIIENAETDWAKAGFFEPVTWIMQRDGIIVGATYDVTLKNPLKQTATATIELEVNDNGREFYFEDSREIKIVFPQEFLALIELNGKFEFIGWFEPDKVRKLTKAKENNIAILRRR